MKSTEVILLVATFAALGFSLYRKYNKKNQGKSGSGSRLLPGPFISSQSKDDDYEPYSKK
jgi:hypothetical protein